MAIPLIYTIHRFDTIKSTNDTALHLADEAAPEGTVVISTEQTAGRGRHGKQWLSTGGVGLYLSVLLRPEKEIREISQLSFLGSLAAADAISHVSKLYAWIKWPNDILINGRKVCGVLVETRNSAAVVGIGINVNNRSFAGELKDKATSILIETGSTVDMMNMETSLLDSFRIVYERYISEGFHTILERWRELDYVAGKSVRVETSEGIIEGTAEGVDESGALIMRQDRQKIAHLHTGTILEIHEP